MFRSLSMGAGRLLLPALLAILVPLLASGTAQASFSDFSAATWDMEGPFDENGESKWLRDVLLLMRGDPERGIPAHDVVSLQEVGGPPAGAEQTDQYAELGDSLAREYIWDVGSPGAPETYYIYHLQVSNDGSPAPDLRTNMAVISRFKGGEFHILRNQTGTDLWTREVIGVRITMPNGNVTRVYSVHAGPNGHDADRIMTHITEYAQEYPAWVAMGNFNRDLLDPNVVMNPPAGATLYRPDGPTYAGEDGTAEVDYGMANEDVDGWIGVRIQMPSSDHAAIHFGPPRQRRQVNPRQ